MSEFDKWYSEKGEKLHIYRHEKWIAKHGFEAGQQSRQAKIDKLQARIDVYELHIKTLKNIHENDFNEESESSYILGNLDGFFECIESDLKVVRDD